MTFSSTEFQRALGRIPVGQMTSRNCDFELKIGLDLSIM
jgi:hypothetical protein